MQDYEKLGVFYLGRRLHARDETPGDEPVLYDSRDLTTHAVIIGMTGSGKTGLGIDLLEEAAIDRVPVIAIDPKGDMGNLLLTSLYESDQPVIVTYISLVAVFILTINIIVDLLYALLNPKIRYG